MAEEQPIEQEKMSPEARIAMLETELRIQRATVQQLIDDTKLYQADVSKYQTRAAELEELNKKLSMTGINEASLLSIEQIATYMRKDAQQLDYLFRKKPYDFVKTMYIESNAIIERLKDQLKDVQVDQDGTVIFEKLDKTDTFFREYPNLQPQNINEDFIKQYEEIANSYHRLMDMLQLWRNTVAEFATLKNAVADGVTRVIATTNDGKGLVLITDEEESIEQKEIGLLKEQLAQMSEKITQMNIQIQADKTAAAKNTGQSAIFNETPAESDEKTDESLIDAKSEPTPKKRTKKWGLI